jgi:CDGSH-type Zn-finger protein/uncharacterized Fe-S cluster protein YjdI
MADRIHKYTGKQIEVTFEGKRCIHAAECVRGLPHVFDKNKTPWIMPDQDTADQIAEIVRRCPTGALKFRRPEPELNESPPQRNQISIERNGPLYLRGDVVITDSAGAERLRDTRVALCRCGQTRRQPFCDSSHRAAKFQAPADIAETLRAPQPAGEPAGPLTVTPAKDGPLLLTGTVEFTSTRASAPETRTDPALCRCGASGSKPFCDGSHHRVNFRSIESA